MSDENQNIENFLRKGLGNKEFQYREEDWQNLEARLDARLDARLEALPPGPSPGMTTGKWIAVSTVLVVVSFLSGWFVNSKIQPEKGSSQEVVNTSEGNFPEQAPAGNLPGATSRNADESKIPVEVDASNEISAASAGTPRPGMKAGPDVKVITPINGSEGEAVSPVHKVENEPGRTKAALAEPATFQARAFARLHGKAAPYAGKKLPLLTLEFGRASYRPAFINNEATSKELKNTGRYKLAIGAAVSPDFSSTRPAPRLNEIGKSYGVFVEFQPLSKWRFSTGVFKADKVYSAGQGDYSPPLYNGWPDGVEPTSTDAACDVLDIPLTAGYRLFDGRKTSFWLSGGISSYWMLSERYYYHYDDYNGYRLKGWWGENENRHPLSVLSFSFSVETFLTQTVSLKLEPFFKAPLAGVGYGKVNLYTSGAFFSIRYHFLKSSELNQSL